MIDKNLSWFTASPVAHRVPAGNCKTPPIHLNYGHQGNQENPDSCSFFLVSLVLLVVRSGFVLIPGGERHAFQYAANGRSSAAGYFFFGM
jgi:hypothetical protein